MKKLFTFFSMLAVLMAASPRANAWYTSDIPSSYLVGYCFTTASGGTVSSWDSTALQAESTSETGVYKYVFKPTASQIYYGIKYAGGYMGGWQKNAEIPLNASSYYGISTYVSSSSSLSSNQCTTTGLDTAKTYQILVKVNSDGSQWQLKVEEVVESGGGSGGGSSVANPSPQVNYPGGTPKMGFEKNGTSVTFCFAAPGKSAVSIKGSWDSYAGTLMNYQDYNGYRYFWTTIDGLDDSTYYPYYYLVDESISVADPYARLVLDPEDEPWIPDGAFPGRPTYPDGQTSRMGVYRGDIDDYDWQVTDFQRASRSTLSIYEMLIRDFTGTNNAANGEGTIAKAIEKIPYLKDLGITAVELMPVFEFDGCDSWGYDPNGLFAVDMAYGSPAKLREFIDVCHQNGIAVIMDMVFNHVTSRHAWSQMYDINSNPFINAEAPHAWSVHQDLKQENPLVEQFEKDVVQYWLSKYKVDGFRFDLVKGMGDSNSYGTSNYYGDNSNSTTVARMKRIHGYMKEINSAALHINEFFGHYDDDCALGNDGQMVWNHQMHDAQLYAACVTDNGACADLEWLSWSAISRPTWGTIDYIESHDEQWLGYLAKNSANVNVSGDANFQARANRLAACGAQLLIAYGPKMIWEFGELGYDDYLTPEGIERLAKKPVHWEYLDDPVRMGIHATYKAMLHLRNDNSDLFASDVTPQYKGFTTDNDNERSVRLVKGDKEVVLLLNQISHESRTVSVGVSKITPSNYVVVASSAGFTPTVNQDGTNISVSIPANGFCVLASKAVNVGPEPDPYTLYWDNSTAKWATPYIHYWGGSESTWPGVAMTKVDGTDHIWKYTVPGRTTNLLFNAGDGDATKTTDFVAAADHVYTAKGDRGLYSPSYAVETPGESSDPDPDPAVTTWALHGSFTSSTWTDVDLTGDTETLVANNVKITYSGAAFGIKEMEGDEQVEWYRAPSATSVSSSTSINLVKESTEGSSNISIARGTYNFSFNYIDKTLDIKLVEAYEEPAPDPSTFDVVYVYGNLGTGSWNTKDSSAGKMTSADGVTYTWTTYSSVAASSSYFRIYDATTEKDYGWDSNYWISSADTWTGALANTTSAAIYLNGLTASANPYGITITFDLSTKKVKYSINGMPTFSIVGYFTDWKATDAYTSNTANAGKVRINTYNYKNGEGDGAGFKVLIGGKVWYGTSEKITVYGKYYALTTSGNNIIIPEESNGGNADFLIDITDMSALKITVLSPNSGVENVSVSDSAEPVYYDLRGVRVENPAPGLYIRRIGSQFSKVIIR